MTSIYKDYVEGSFNKKTISNNMHISFNYNISEFAGSLEGMLDEGTQKKNINNMHNIGWKAQFLKSTDILMLGHGCGVSQYPKFYDRIKKYINCYHVHMWEGI